MRVVPVVALYAGCDDMLTKAECVIRQTQNNDKAVAGGLAGARWVYNELDLVYMSRVVRKPAFAYANTKLQVSSCVVTTQLISAFAFAT